MTSRDFLRERLQRAFTRANQLPWTAQYRSGAPRYWFLLLFVLFFVCLLFTWVNWGWRHDEDVGGRLAPCLHGDVVGVLLVKQHQNLHRYTDVGRKDSPGTTCKMPVSMQESFWWWQCSDRYIISLFPPPPYPFPPLSPSLVSLMVSVDLSTMFTYLHAKMVRAQRLCESRGGRPEQSL